MRKREAATLFLLAALAVTAGCLGGDADETSSLDLVPAEADGVVYFDVTVVEEPDAERVGDAFLEVAAEDPEYDGPTEYDEALDEISEEATDELDFDPLDVEEAVGYWRFPSWDETEEEFGDDWLSGMVVDFSDEADVQPSELHDELVSVGEHAGGELYAFEDVEEVEDAEALVGTLPAGEQGYDYAFGTPESVKMLIEVDAGERSSPEGTLREEYGALQDGYLKASFVVPEQVTEALLQDEEMEQLAEESLFNYDLLFDFRGASVAYRLKDGTHMTETRLLSATEETAEDFEQGIDGYISLARALASDEQRDTFDDVEVERDGKVVITTDETTVDDMVDAVEEFADEYEPPEEPTPSATAGVSVSQ